MIEKMKNGDNGENEQQIHTSIIKCDNINTRSTKALIMPWDSLDVI